MNEFNIGLAAPLRKLEGDAMASLSLPCIAVPDLGSIYKPFYTRFGNLIA